MIEDFANILSPYGFGDTFILCLLKDEIEKEYRVKVRFIIKPSHVAILKMFSYEYDVKKYTEDELRVIALDSTSIEAGKDFVAHPHYINPEIETDFFEHRISFFEFYKRTLNLCIDRLPLKEINYPDYDFKKKISECNNLIVYAPEKTSCRARIDMPNKEWTINFADILNRDNAQVITNLTNESEKKNYPNALDMTVEELISVCINCKEVYSLRSGLCDVICLKSRKLNVIYTTVDDYYDYSLYRVYPSELLEGRVKEYLINYKEYFAQENISTCALYGMGENGRRFYRVLRFQGIDVRYGIDMNPNVDVPGVKIYSDCERYPEVDCIIICTQSDNTQIVDFLKDRVGESQIINVWEMDFWYLKQPLLEVTNE